MDADVDQGGNAIFVVEDLAKRRGKHSRLLLLDAHAVDKLLTPEGVTAAVREAFILHSRGSGRVFPLIREHLATGGVFGIKAGDIPGESILGFKAAGFWPANRDRGGEPHQATIVLVDPMTGRPLCIIDGNAVTTMRTGAAGGIGAALLSRPDSARLCVFGTGVQARIQVRFALRARPSVREIRYLTVDGRPQQEFEELFSAERVTVHTTDAAETVAASDIVITATPGAGPLFAAEAVRPGTHVTCVGADTRGKRELPPGVLERATVFVDDRIQAGQVGELQWAPPDTPTTEVGELLDGAEEFHRTHDEVTIFDMTGLALQDLTVAAELYRQAGAAGLGTTLAWPW